MKLHADSADEVLFLGGLIMGDATGNVVSPGVIRWDGNAYGAMGCGLGAGSWDCVSPIFGGGPVNEMTSWNGSLFAGGAFDHSGTTPIANIAQWTGAEWFPLGGGVDGPVYGMKAGPDGLYVCGVFLHADTLTVNGLARWDGSSWHTVHDLPQLYSGDINRIFDLAFYNGELYIGGKFNGVGGMNDIAKFNGTEWVSVDGAGFIGVFSSVNRLKVHDDLLYVAGSFADYPPYGNPANPGSGILAWDGSNWIDLAGGTDGAGNASVLDMVWIRDTLYTVGRYNVIGGVPTGRVARWDGTRWCSLVPPGYFYPDIVSIGVFRDTLYVGGSFTTAGPDSINRVAKWIGGAYVDSCGFGVGLSEVLAPATVLTLFPNPATDQLHLAWSGAPRPATVLVHDALGREVLRLPWPASGDLPVRSLRHGVYQVRLLNVDGTVLGTARFVKE